MIQEHFTKNIFALDSKLNVIKIKCGRIRIYTTLQL